MRGIFKSADLSEEDTVKRQESNRLSLALAFVGNFSLLRSEDFAIQHE
jgi:hypothetical protein